MGTAARFDAANDRISYTGGTAAPDSAAGFTFTAWVYLSTDRNDFSTIFRLYSSSFGTRFTLSTGSNGTTPAIYSVGNTSGVVSSTSFTVGSWFVIGVSISGTTGEIHFAASSSMGSPSSMGGNVSGGATAQGFTLGGRDPNDSSEWFDGRIKYPRVWADNLSLGEIQSEWNSPTAVRTTDLWGAWILSGPGDLSDQSGNGRNLTAGSTAVTAEAGTPIDPASSFPLGSQFLSFF